MSGLEAPLDAAEWRDVAAGIVAYYPSTKATADDLAPWHARLAAIPGDLVLEAVDLATARSRFVPSLAELLGAVDDVRDERRRNVAAQAADLDVRRAARDERDYNARSVNLASHVARGCPSDPRIDGRTTEERLALVARMLERGTLAGAAGLLADNADAAEARRRLAPYLAPGALERLVADRAQLERGTMRTWAEAAR